MRGDRYIHAPSGFLDEYAHEEWMERSGIAPEPDEAEEFRGELMTLLPPPDRYHYVCTECGADGSEGRGCKDCQSEEDER